MYSKSVSFFKSSIELSCNLLSVMPTTAADLRSYCLVFN